MKKTAWITIMMWMACIVPCIGSCGGNDSPDNPSDKGSGNVSVAVSPENLAAGPEATALELTVNVSADWAIVSDRDWATVRPSGGVKNVSSKITVRVAANNALDDRTAALSIVCGGKTVKTVPLIQECAKSASASVKTLAFGAQASESKITVTSNTAWTLSADAAWLTVSPSAGEKGETEVTVKAALNDTKDTRDARLTLSYAGSQSEISVSQLSDEITVPDGYALVWSDEFNEGTTLNPSDWTHEVQKPGWVNHELQHYVNGSAGGKRVTELKDGMLNINCFKGSDGNIYSGRVYARVGTGWTYGYFEARISLPSGKGTWPAFWMMPVGNDWTTNPWPKCGEIDIMEEVGYNPDMVSSSLHTEKYNHTKGTQKTHEMRCAGAEGGFHVYALEWTEDGITTYVDGKVQLKATKASMGADHDSWPFHYAFYPILNLAWGGDWGGSQGVDESALPVTMKVDYLRVFQKK